MTADLGKQAVAEPHAGGPRSRLPVVVWHDELAETEVTGGGARDDWSIPQILALIPQQSWWSAPSSTNRRVVDGARDVLAWLARVDADGWQRRWLVSGSDRNTDWVDELVKIEHPLPPERQRIDLFGGISALILLRIVFPSYDLLNGCGSSRIYNKHRLLYRPDLYALMQERASARGIDEIHCREALTTISRITTRTGKDPDQLTAEDLLAYRAWHRRAGRQVPKGLSLGWSLLYGIADLGEHPTLENATRRGQLTAAEIVDHYRVHPPQVREVFTRYFDERRPHVDYATWSSMATLLLATFWYDIQTHHPELTTLRLPRSVIEAWKVRLRTAPTRFGVVRSEDHYFQVLIMVRAFYRDLQDWAVHDPSWAQWSFPNPIRKNDTRGAAKADKRRQAVMAQRIRERMQQLPVLVEVAERHRVAQGALLGAAARSPAGHTFTHEGRAYRRPLPAVGPDPSRLAVRPPDLIEDLTTGVVVDIGRAEQDAFWAWAVIEVLRHTGIRIEELLEITHLGLIAYTLPGSGEVVPMLQIVPSKSNEERLLLVSPELARVLAEVISRLRAHNGGTVPLTARYDAHEKVTGPALPHLFQRRHVWTWKTFSYTAVQNYLCDTLARAGLTDAAGQPLRYTPHDFRRLWATDAVSNGLPIHIAAKLLGHRNINTTQTYVAVFDEHLVRSYRAFLDDRRALRPEAEYRNPTEVEWREFEQHFELRKLELGTCSRPYGSPCRHEHACIRCPSLRVDPRARPRLIEITANLRDRIAEAKANGWTGEAEGLRVSLHAAAAKLVSLDKMNERTANAPSRTNLGLPAFPS
ncbi:tyrosine-type recombinase/integrase [Nocardia jejuensis]|uniref:tyrosine-type recombinase/integrase n=1 Tax=Nocardia jejuensis TaxID=328049 RepID=UPI000A613D1A|nr:site-specific integrase [Nocardia jejuensis]